MSEPIDPRRNLALLAERVPKAAAIVGGVRDPLSRLVLEGGRAVDIDLGAGRLYKEPADGFAADQVARFLADPPRIGYNPPQADDIASDMMRDMNRFMAERAGGDLPQAPVAPGGFLAVFGVGLGLHLPALVERTSARHVLVVEPIGEFLMHSLHALDWPGLLETAARRDVTVDLVADADPDAAVEALDELVVKYGPAFVDGCGLFVHYRTDVIDRIEAEFRVRAALHSIARGYFEDEAVMVRNFLANVLAERFRAMDGRALAPRPEPVFIVGSGPSVSGAVETLKRWQGHAMVFSCGSSLEFLLHHGIRPDFHVEKENLECSAVRLNHLFDKSPDAKGSIPLVASATVNSQVPGMFGEKLLFFRDSVSSSRIFAPDYVPMEAVGPYVANTALSAAATFGFKNALFFGCDCGHRVGQPLHAENTAYATNKDYRPPKQMERDQEWPANFGGVVRTNPQWQWSRRMFEQVIAGRGMLAANCSDGIRIEGAAPVPPDKVAFKGGPLDKAAIAAEVIGAYRPFEPGGFPLPAGPDAFDAAWTGLARDVAGMVSAAKGEDADMEAFHPRVRAFLDRSRQAHLGLSAMIEGSAPSLAQLARYYLVRVADEGDRKTLFKDFLDRYGKLLDGACARGRALFRDLTPS